MSTNTNFGYTIFDSTNLFFRCLTLKFDGFLEPQFNPIYKCLTKHVTGIFPILLSSSRKINFVSGDSCNNGCEDFQRKIFSIYHILVFDCYHIFNVALTAKRWSPNSFFGLTDHIYSDVTLFWTL